MDERKIRVSILTRIAILFVAALIIAFAGTFWFSYKHMMEDAEAQSVEVSTAAATAAMTAIGSEENFYALYEDEAFRDKVHESFRFICRRTNLRYLYLYTIGEDRLRHYVICAARSDADDERLQEEYGFGSVRETPLYQAEENVLAGDTDDNYELIDNDFGSVCMTVTPVRDGDGRIIAMIGSDDDIEVVKHTAVRDLFSLMLIGLLIIFINYVIALLMIKQSVIRPIQALSGRMRSFANDRKKSAAGRRDTIYADEITDIEKAFDTMTADIDRYVTDIEDLTREKVFNQTQLDVARKIQSGIVPREYELSEDGFETFGCMLAAREVGGDFYDAFRLEDGRTGVVIGDISDKGIPAALFMAMVKTSIKEKLEAGHGLAETLNRVNRELCASNPGNMFATVFAMTIQPQTGIVTYANAGHEEPLLLGEEPSYLEVRSGIAIGLFEDSDIVEERLVLRGGECILLYTDGITEAIDADRRQYGKDRLKEAVARKYREGPSAGALVEDATEAGAPIEAGAPTKAGAPADARALVEDAVASVVAFTGGAEQFDDITCLAVINRDAVERMISLSPDLDAFDAVIDAAQSALGENDHSKGVILACEEIFTNIVNYSGADRIAFSSKRTGDTWMITYADNGRAFDPVAAERKVGEFEELDQGGMGILFARRNSRDMIYSRIGVRNVLTMVFDAEAGQGL